MLFSVAKTYDLSRNYISVGGAFIGGADDDGFIEYAQVSEWNSVTYGADGEATVSRQNIKGLVATITLKETSNSVPILDALRAAQERQRKIQPLPFQHVDELSGDTVTSLYAIFVNGPEPSKARNAGERTYEIHLPYPKVTEGPANPLPF